MAAKFVSVVRLPASAWLLLLPALLVPVASATDSISTACIDSACPVHGDGELSGDDVQLLQLRGGAQAEAGAAAGTPRRRRRRRPEEEEEERYAMFVIGSNNVNQTAKRMGLDESDITPTRAYLDDYQREFRGLSTGRSYGAVCTPIPAFGKKLKGALLWFDSKSKKYIPRDGRGDSRKAGTDTLSLLDTWEGVSDDKNSPLQYERIKKNVTYLSSSGRWRVVVATVYRLAEDRRIVMGNGNELYKESTRRRKFPYGYWNNGMVSKGYIDAVLDMLDESWGRTRISAAEDFPPAQWTQVCRELRNDTYVGCHKAGYVVMFDDSKCNNTGKVERGQRRKACNTTGQPGEPPAPEMFNKEVPKYNVNDYVPHRMKVEMGSAVMGPPKPPAKR